MKNSKFTLLLVFLFSTSLIACSHQESLYTASDIISRGDWGVAYLYTGLDKTGEFEKATLKFMADGKLTYTNNSQMITGEWGMIKDEGGFDLLTISISGQSNVAELNSKWSVTQKSTTNISLLSKGEEKQLRIRKL